MSGGTNLIIQLEQARQGLKEMRPKIDELAASLRVDKLEERSKELEAITSDPAFWNNPEESQKVLTEVKDIME